MKKFSLIARAIYAHLTFDFWQLYSNITIMNETHTNGSLDAELQQLSILNEMRQRNQMTEMYRHVFNVLGSIISVCGIIGITNRFIY